MFRGQISAHDMDVQMSQTVSKNSAAFVEWIPNNIKASICNVPPVGMKVCAFSTLHLPPPPPAVISLP